MNIADLLKHASPDVLELNGGVLAPQQPAASADNALRGAANKAAGDAFEQRLDAYHARLRESYRAVVEKTNPPMRYVGNGRYVPVGSAIVDYVGHTWGGKGIHFDAKVRSDEQGFSIAQRDMHQLEWLWLVAEYGCYAGYLVYWTAHDTVCWHPVQTVDGQRIRYEDGAPLDGVDWFDEVIP